MRSTSSENTHAKYERIPDQIISGQALFNFDGKEVSLTKDDQIPDSVWTSENEIVLFKNKKVLHPNKQHPGMWEAINMVFRRSLLIPQNNKGLSP